MVLLRFQGGAISVGLHLDVASNPLDEVRVALLHVRQLELDVAFVAQVAWSGIRAIAIVVDSGAPHTALERTLLFVFFVNFIDRSEEVVVAVLYVLVFLPEAFQLVCTGAFGVLNPLEVVNFVGFFGSILFRLGGLGIVLVADLFEELLLGSFMCSATLLHAHDL